jgi:hypothetical protein
MKQLLDRISRRQVFRLCCVAWFLPIALNFAVATIGELDIGWGSVSVQIQT